MISSLSKMDSETLFEAARDGEVEVLARLLQENRPIRADIRLMSSLGESVLHVATKYEQLNFVNELMKIDPDMAREMNKDAFRPLDIAVIMGNLTIVKTILSFNCDLGRLKSKDDRTALHVAVVKGRVDIVDELLSVCPDCLDDVTVHRETALHLAVKHYQFDVFYELVKWLERLGKESIVNNQDSDGNTVLHLAVSTKQYACLNLLLDEKYSIRGATALNIQNINGLTAPDTSGVVIQDSYDAKIQKLMLRHSGKTRAQDSTTITAQQSRTNSRPIQHHLQSEPTSVKNWLNYFKFQTERDSPSDTRNAMLVVAALIATVTFQAGVSPPSQLFDTSQNKEIFAFLLDTFLFWNCLGFSASSIIILYLTSGFPFHRELFISILSMILTYFVATCVIVTGTRDEGNAQHVAFGLLVFGLFLPYFVRWPPIWSRYYARVARKALLPIRNSNNVK